MQDITRTLDVLTAMIAANMKRNKLYLSLAEKTNQDELRHLFTQCADQSRRFISSLSTWRSAYGGFAIMDRRPDTNSTWTQIRSLLDFGAQKNMLIQCEDLEQDVLRTYKSALNMSCMPAATTADVQQQYKDVEKALSKLRSLRERPAAARQVFART